MTSGWHEHRDATGDFGIRIRSQAFARSRRRGIFGDPKARIIALKRRSKNDVRVLWSGANGLVHDGLT
jgi:hypothetical protein